VRILNKIVTVTENGLEYEANQRHMAILMKDMGIDEGSNGVSTPRVSTNKRGASGASRRREHVQSNCDENELLGSSPCGRAVRGEENFKVHVKAGGARL
jgi:hypothetical protein